MSAKNLGGDTECPRTSENNNKRRKIAYMIHIQERYDFLVREKESNFPIATHGKFVSTDQMRLTHRWVSLNHEFIYRTERDIGVVL